MSNKKKSEELIGLTLEQTQTLGNYLVTRPYVEVEKLIEILKTAQRVNVMYEQPNPPPAPVGGEDAPEETTKAE